MRILRVGGQFLFPWAMSHRRDAHCGVQEAAESWHAIALLPLMAASEARWLGWLGADMLAGIWAVGGGSAGSCW